MNQPQNALNDVHVLLQKSADHYNEAAEVFSSHQTEDVFRKLASERRSMADVLESHIRKYGLPKNADPESELFEKWFTQIKSALSHNEQLTVIKEREHSEEELDHRVTQALQQPLDDETRAFLQDLARKINDSRAHLATAHAQLQQNSP